MEIRYTKGQGEYHCMGRAIRLGMVSEECRRNFVMALDCDYIVMPMGHEWVDKVTQLHEFAHAMLDIPERDEGFRRYKKQGHYTIEEEALAWALVLRWVNCPERVRTFACDSPQDRLAGYVEYWKGLHCGGSRAVAKEWLAQAEACIDEAFRVGTWPSSASWLKGC